MQTGMWTAHGSPADPRRGRVPRVSRDSAGRTSPLHSSEDSSGHPVLWPGGREETRLPQMAWAAARQDPWMVSDRWFRNYPGRAGNDMAVRPVVGCDRSPLRDIGNQQIRNVDSGAQGPPDGRGYPCASACVVVAI